MSKRSISSNVPVLVIIGTLIVGLVSGIALSAATFGLVNTTTIIITQTTVQSGNDSYPTANLTLNLVPYAAQVSISGFAYSPQSVTVVIGINNTVMWTNMDDEDHTVTSANSTFDSGPLSPGQTFQYTFTTPGIYEYTCSFHPWMEGIVVVKNS